MSTDNPVFFISYSSEKDPWLDHFFKKLKWHVFHLAEGHVDIECVGFLDDHNIKNGEDWDTIISGALQTSKVLICLYSPRFFMSDYCARELAGFLQRQRNEQKLWYESVRQPDGQIKSYIRDTRNIIPILWAGENDLKNMPSLVKKIQYT